MKNILASPQIRKLKNLPREKTLLVFDFDGTLAPLVSKPTEAGLRKTTEKLFLELTRNFRCAVLSGRSYPVIRKLTRRYQLLYVVGDHGMDWGIRSAHLKKIQAETLRRKKLIARKLAGVEGLHIENKRYSVTVHYRGARNQKAALRAIRKIVPEIPRSRIMYNKKNVEFMPVPGSDKGKALAKLIRLTRAKRTFYMGDDQTDEDAFRLRKKLNLVSVHVGRSQHSIAQYYLPSQSDVDQLLRSFLK